MIQFSVSARCPTKGSTHSFRHRATGRMITHQNNRDALRAFSASVAIAAKGKFGAPTDGLVRLTLGFYFKTPKSYLNKDGSLKPGKNVGSRTFGDIDKLERAVLDALTGIAYFDDCQVAELHSKKSLSFSDRVDIIVEEI